MAELREYCIVHRVELFRPSNECNDWGVNQRNPQIGNTGALIDGLRAPNLPDKYVVENAGIDGIPILISEFLTEEIEPIVPSGDSFAKLVT